jgi:hypothetical protein
VKEEYLGWQEVNRSWGLRIRVAGGRRLAAGEEEEEEAAVATAGDGGGDVVCENWTRMVGLGLFLTKRPKYDSFA